MKSRFSLLFSIQLFILFSCSDYGIKPIEVAPNLFVFIGEGGNSGVFISDSAVLVIDTKMKVGSNLLSDWVNDHASNKKVIVINTHIHKDHTGGNHLFKNAEVIAGDYGEDFWLKLNTVEDLPTVWLEDKLEMQLGDEKVIIENAGQAHTFADLIVYFTKSKVLFTGDIVLNGYHPFFDEEAGAELQGYESAIQHMLYDFDLKTVIPGHGNAGGKEVIENFNSYLSDMKIASENLDEEVKMQEKYQSCRSIPVNKAGFDLTLDFIRKSETLRN